MNTTDDTPATDEVTGARVEIAVLVELSRERLWERATDVPRYGDWSPECVHTEWLQLPPGPRPGGRFSGRNRFPNGFEATTLCLVTEVRRPEAFEWAVLDPSEDPDRPGSIWRYELTQAGENRTLLRHIFTHGPGDTGARTGAARSSTALAARLDQIRANMAASLSAMLDGVRVEEAAP